AVKALAGISGDMTGRRSGKSTRHGPADREVRGMKTVVVLGSADHGRPMTYEEFAAAQGADGYLYELIDGKVCVSPVPDLPHDRLWEWLDGLLRDYSRARPDVMNYVTSNAQVIVPGREEATRPEPDLAAYSGFPRDRPLSDVTWEDVSPLLVVEIVSADDPE